VRGAVHPGSSPVRPHMDCGSSPMTWFPPMKPFLRQQLERFPVRLQELDFYLSQPEVVNDMKRFRELTREHAEVTEVAGACQRCRTEIMSESEGEVGGFKEVVLRVVGEATYGKLKFESGGHRVQRVPATESQGRIHTSACTVAALPEPDEAAAVKINPADLRI